MSSFLHSLPDGNSKWRPTLQPAKIDPEDSCPEPEPSSNSSFDSSLDSINEENIYINNISTQGLESTIIQRTLFIDRNIRLTQGISQLNSFLSLILFKARVLQIEYRSQTVKKILKDQASRKISKFFKEIRKKKRLSRIKLSICGRKLARFFKKILDNKKEFNLILLERFKEHCAVIIQKQFRGYLVRKNFSIYLKFRKERVKAWVLGWKTRRVFRNPEISALKGRALTEIPARLQLIQKVNNLIEGDWGSKWKVPQHQRILYKNHTKKLRIAHERKLSSQSLDDSIQKEKEKKLVKFSLKNHESPKNYEPDLKAQAKKSILKSHLNPEEIDWKTLQEQLDRVFYESQGRLSIDDPLNEKQHVSLLFKRKPRMKKKEKEMEMRNWDLADFEYSCEEDFSKKTGFPFLSHGRIPSLGPDSAFWQVEDLQSLYVSLKKDYNFFKSSKLSN